MSPRIRAEIVGSVGCVKRFPPPNARAANRPFAVEIRYFADVAQPSGGESECHGEGKCDGEGECDGEGDGEGEG